MVRRSLSVLVCACALIAGIAISAGAATPYEGSISSTLLDIADNVPMTFSDDYVFYRSGQYEYKLVYGNLAYNNGTFLLVDPLTEVTISQVTQTGYGSTSYYSYEQSELTSFQLSPGNFLVYSNLGGYPNLNEGGDSYYEAVQTVLLCAIICIFALLRPLTDFINRRR